ncbi:outer membrane beta-barrel protein [Helicobacter sp. 11S03491-1]|uniref:outer membrane beta-barrel protein n=1 Tax=Helicobacter sp. 11S03491-1 TaxID=1476196 RepID=UPI000BA6D3AC|nr:outer membrane beta-barrel protein [Helicobacter sp. 11S03491-1]PAF43330.1 hypothetical protein BKH45_01440 [Helicobacter sp. 11S03491-1]
MKRFTFIIIVGFCVGITHSELKSQEIQFQDARFYLASVDKKDQISTGENTGEYYPNQDYIQSHYPDISGEKKQKLIAKYRRADRKSGLFIGINVGLGTLYSDYLDGRYNQSTTIVDLKSQRTGVFKSPLQTKTKLGMFGGKIGYQSFFNPYFGARVYGDVMLSGGLPSSGVINKEDGEKIGSLIYMLGSLNLDLLADIPLSSSYKHFIGGYLGLGFGSMILLDEANQEKIRPLLNGSYHSNNILWNTLLQVDYTFNAGLSLTINTKNRIEVGAKIPWAFLRLGLESPAKYKNDNGETKTLESKDIEFKRSVIWTASYIYLF